jgi:hypothetical protein
MAPVAAEDSIAFPSEIQEKSFLIIEYSNISSYAFTGNWNYSDTTLHHNHNIGSAA